MGNVLTACLRRFCPDARSGQRNDKPIALYKHSKIELFVSSSSERDGAPGASSSQGGSGG
jgi:hypothetical protein